MIVSVQNADVKIGKKALSGVKSVTKKNKNLKKDKKKSDSKPFYPALDESALKKIREQREHSVKQKNERWRQVLTEVAKRSDLSDIHKEMLNKCIEPQIISIVPRRLKKAFTNFIILSCTFEAKHTDAAAELFGILKTAEGSIPSSVRRKENKKKAALKKKEKKAKWALRKQMKLQQQGELSDDSTSETKKSDKMEVGVANEDVDMDSEVKTEIKSEQGDESSDDDDSSNAGEGLVVNGRSKKNRRKLEKVGKKVVHLTKKLPKNMKGKGKNNKKNRKK